MANPKFIEYQVRKIERYIVTRYEQDGNGAGVSQVGEYPDQQIAFAVAYALCKKEHDDLGWPVGDERIQYPREFETPEDARSIPDTFPTPPAS